MKAHDGGLSAMREIGEIELDTTLSSRQHNARNRRSFSYDNKGHAYLQKSPCCGKVGEQKNNINMCPFASENTIALIHIAGSNTFKTEKAR